MNQAVAELWAKALPNYKQTRKRLRIGDNFCCLGVLCELAAEAGVIPKAVVDTPSATRGSEIYGYCGRTNYLPREVQDWAGMAASDGGWKDINGEPSLVDMNDKGAPFASIANFITNNWVHL